MLVLLTVFDILSSNNRIINYIIYYVYVCVRLYILSYFKTRILFYLVVSAYPIYKYKRYPRDKRDNQLY